MIVKSAFGQKVFRRLSKLYALLQPYTETCNLQKCALPLGLRADNYIYTLQFNIRERYWTNIPNHEFSHKTWFVYVSALAESQWKKIREKWNKVWIPVARQHPLPDKGMPSKGTREEESTASGQDRYLRAVRSIHNPSRKGTWPTKHRNSIRPTQTHWTDNETFNSFM